MNMKLVRKSANDAIDNSRQDAAINTNIDNNQYLILRASEAVEVFKTTGSLKALDTSIYLLSVLRSKVIKELG